MIVGPSGAFCKEQDPECLKGSIIKGVRKGDNSGIHVQAAVRGSKVAQPLGIKLRQLGKFQREEEQALCLLRERGNLCPGMLGVSIWWQACREGVEIPCKKIADLLAVPAGGNDHPAQEIGTDGVRDMGPVFHWILADETGGDADTITARIHCYITGAKFFGQGLAVVLAGKEEIKA